MTRCFSGWHALPLVFSYYLADTLHFAGQAGKSPKLPAQTPITNISDTIIEL
ncbi:MAG: hypothetical protein NTY08_17200 [Proteobacteria bacterium]|nr:hypothetical protein [Pseudomonadota bacterium]